MDAHMTRGRQPGAATVRASTARAVLALLLVLALILLLPPPAGAEAQSRWSWPIAPPHTVQAPFDEPAGPYGPGHRGIDILAETPTVTAVEAGTVHFAGMVAGRPVVSVRHADGMLSTYEPVVASVAVGTAVEAGTPIGEVAPGAASHCAPALCLHLGARRDRSYLDPLLLLGARGPSVLLPLSGSGAARPGGDAGTGDRAGAGGGAGTGDSAGTGGGAAGDVIGASVGSGAGAFARAATGSGARSAP